MVYLWLADLVLALHLLFVLFALFGGLLALRYPRMLWLHLPALLWGVFVEWADRICPLTPLENHLRQLGGSAGYSGSFIEHWAGRILYPQGLTPELRYVFGAALLLVNVAVYAAVIRAWRRQRRTSR